METIETLNKMKDVLLEDGWCKGVLQNEVGEVCLTGARNKVLGYSMEILEGEGYKADYISDLIESVLPPRCRRNEELEDTVKLWVFNDGFAHSVNDVLGAIDEAILAERERSL